MSGSALSQVRHTACGITVGKMGLSKHARRLVAAAAPLGIAAVATAPGNPVSQGVAVQGGACAVHAFSMSCYSFALELTAAVPTAAAASSCSTVLTAVTHIRISLAIA